MLLFLSPESSSPQFTFEGILGRRSYNGILRRHVIMGYSVDEIIMANMPRLSGICVESSGLPPFLSKSQGSVTL